MRIGKDKLIKFVLFRENDCSALELYLEEMAEKGWMFDSVSPIMHFLQFKKCEPKKVKFCVDVCEEFSKDFMSDFNLPQYIDICEHEGWQHVTSIDSFTSAIGSSSSYQVFISDDINTPPIQADDKLKLNPIFKSSMQNMIMSIILMIFTVYNIKSNYSTDFEMLNWAFLSILIALIPYVHYIIESFIWFFRAKKSLNENRPIRYVSLKSLKLKTIIIDLLILMFLICILFFYTLIYMDTSVQFFTLNILKAINLIIFIFGIVFLIEVVRENIVPIDKINK